MQRGTDNEDVGARLDFAYLILADGAQIQGGKLYVLGGGWDRIQLPQYPYTLNIGLAFGVTVPWNETNQKHHFKVSGVSADGKQLFDAEGEFEVGRPPGIPPGMPQLFQAAMGLPLHVPGPGQYEITAEVDSGKAIRRLPYWAIQVPS